MAYTFKGKREPQYTPVADDGNYAPFSEKEVWAKFMYFRKAEKAINGGPAPVEDEPMPTRLRAETSECGTNSGYARHVRAKEEPCRECRVAMNDYQREYRARRKVAA